MITWSCHVCRRVRPDDKISVFTRDISAQYGLPQGTMTENIRYCDDNPSCCQASKMTSLVGLKEPCGLKNETPEVS